MARSIVVKNTVIGEGMPCICVPLTQTDAPGLDAEAEQAAAVCPDLGEWRADCFENIFSPSHVEGVLKRLSGILDSIPLIFTVRTQKEGGSLQVSQEDYIRLLKHAADTKIPSFVDIEVMQMEFSRLLEVVDWLRKKGILVIGSSHHFERTPSEMEMEAALKREDEAGADILKLAVMPHDYRDTARLLRVTGRMSRENTQKPLITMSMGDLGSASRFCGEIFGSAVTFATAGRMSAPGQLPIDELRTLLQTFHEFI